MKPTDKTVILPVTGMNCASCASSVESMAATQPGVLHAAVNYASQTLKLTYNEASLKSNDLQKIGYFSILTTNTWKL